ncbi:MAG: hypothetical protein C0446_08350 [Chitinophaga sp.]|nr:hypothetical protein [Chitinophaga sp.]
MTQSYIKCLLAKAELGMVTKKSVDKIKSMLDETSESALQGSDRDVAIQALNTLEDRLLIKAENAVRHANLVNEGAKRLSLLKTQDDVLPVLRSFGFFDEADNIKYGYMGRSADSSVTAHSNYWLAKFNDVFDNLKEDQKWMFFSDQRQKEIIESIFDLTRNTKNKTHSNIEADRLAKIIVDMTQEGAAAARAAGQFVSSRVDHSIGRHPITDKIIKAGRESYIEDSFKATDIARVREATGGLIDTEGKLKAFFGHEWDNLRSGGVLDVPDFIPKGAKSVVNKRNHPRIIHFKDAQSYLDWHTKYGSTTLLEQLSNYANNLGRDIGILETYGPQPQAFLRSMFRIAGEKGFSVSKADQDIIFRHFMYNSNQWDRALNPSLEKYLASQRAYFSSTLLGSTPIAAIADSIALPLVANSMRGLPILRTMWRNLKTFTKPGAVKADIKTLSRIGVLNDYFLNESAAQMKMMDLEVGHKFATTAASTIHKLSLLTRMTNATKSTSILELSADLAETPFIELGKDLQNWIGKFGITKEVLEKMQEFGKELVGPNKDVNILSPFKLKEAGLKDEAVKLSTLLTQRQEIASPTTSARMNAYWGQLARNGKAAQIFVGSSRTFTGYMASFYNNILRTIYANTSSFNKLKRTANMFIMLGLGGSLSIMIRDLVNGKDPTLDSRTILRGLNSTLAIPFVSDYLLNDKMPFGQSPFDRAHGVALSTVGDVLGTVKSLAYGEPVKALRQAQQLATQFIPGQSLWWASLVLRRTVLDQVRYLYDPQASKYFNRQIRDAKQNNTPFWWKPGKLQPDDYPDLENLFDPTNFINTKGKK